MSALPLTGIASPRYLGFGLKIEVKKSLVRARNSRISLLFCPLYGLRSEDTPYASRPSALATKLRGKDDIFE